MAASSETWFNFGTEDEPEYISLRFVSRVKADGSRWMVNFTRDSGHDPDLIDSERGLALLRLMGVVPAESWYDKNDAEIV